MAARTVRESVIRVRRNIFHLSLPPSPFNSQLRYRLVERRLEHSVYLEQIHFLFSFVYLVFPLAFGRLLRQQGGGDIEANIHIHMYRERKSDRNGRTDSDDFIEVSWGHDIDRKSVSSDAAKIAATRPFRRRVVSRRVIFRW